MSELRQSAKEKECPGGGCKTGSLECWRRGHVPYVAVILGRTNSYLSVYEIVFARYMRMKKFAWPDEVKRFNGLYKAKHPEIVSGRVRNMMEETGTNGAAYVKEKYSASVVGLFGFIHGVLYGSPCTPTKDDAERAFFKLASMKMYEMTRRGRSVYVREGYRFCV